MIGAKSVRFGWKISRNCMPGWGQNRLVLRGGKEQDQYRHRLVSGIPKNVVGDGDNKDPTNEYKSILEPSCTLES